MGALWPTHPCQETRGLQGICPQAGDSEAPMGGFVIFLCCPPIVGTSGSRQQL